MMRPLLYLLALLTPLLVVNVGPQPLAFACGGQAQDTTESSSEAHSFVVDAETHAPGQDCGNSDVVKVEQLGAVCETLAKGHMCPGALTCGNNGTVHYVTIYFVDGTQVDSTRCYDDSAPVLTPAMVLEAFKEVPVPIARTSISPHHGFVLINRPFVMSTSAESFRTPVRILSFDVTLDIKPTGYLWRVGSDTFTTDWPGRSYNGGDASDYLSYTPSETGALPVSVDVTWSATYSVDGGPALPVPGTVTRVGPVTNLTSQSGPAVIEDTN